MLSSEPGMIDYFWNKQIDLIPSTKRKNIIKFSMLDAIVENESEAINIPKMLTKNVVTSMIQILSKVETSTDEESIVLAVLERIISKAKDEKQILKPILKLLLQEHGKITFDKITGNHLHYHMITIRGAFVSPIKYHFSALQINTTFKHFRTWYYTKAYYCC